MYISYLIYPSRCENRFRHIATPFNSCVIRTQPIDPNGKLQISLRETFAVPNLAFSPPEATQELQRRCPHLWNNPAFSISMKSKTWPSYGSSNCTLFAHSRKGVVTNGRIMQAFPTLILGGLYSGYNACWASSPAANRRCMKRHIVPDPSHPRKCDGTSCHPSHSRIRYW